jgi:hypothetical protein
MTTRIPSVWVYSADLMFLLNFRCRGDFWQY